MSTGPSSWAYGRVRCADAVHARLFDDELIMLDLARGEYFSLDHIGAHLWAGLEAGRTFEEIAGEIAAQYDVTPERALADLFALGEELIAKGLIVRDERTGSGDDR